MSAMVAPQGSARGGHAHPAEALGALLAEAHRVADELLGLIGGLGDGSGVDGSELRSLEGELTRLRHRVDAGRLRLGAVARAQREAGRMHHRDERQFFGRGGRMDGAPAARDDFLAGALGNPVPAGRPAPSGPGGAAGRTRAGQGATGQALDQGLISPDHAQVIAKALQRLPEQVTPEERRVVEQELVRKAQRVRPSELRREARRCLAAAGWSQDALDTHENHQVATEEEQARARAAFRIRHDQDGTSTGSFTLPSLQGRQLEKVLREMVAPRKRNRPGGGGAAGVAGRERGMGHERGVGHERDATDAGSTAATADEAWRERQLDWQHEQGKALADLVDHLPTGHLHGAVNYSVVVHTDLETLRGECDRAGVTDVGETVSAGQVRRLAAQARIIPSVLGGDSLPLDLGTARRFFTDAQRMAVSRLYTHCAVEDCDIPFSWCEMHHDEPWAARRGGPPSARPPEPAPDDGRPQGAGPPGTRAAGPGAGRGRGRTDLSNLIPLCGHHNRLVERPGVVHRVVRDDRGRATVVVES
ncbi:protein of unknown function [Kytococcus aerolatus]|uniref:DUF222 domain-containing protein n=1 Tax=Kytococcus aerolatus TaxID=592308 RepID=A0A212TAH3_9MICO|nr:DUF222 domain-containing protein [Kytococcus aerolatus]SNC63057.1 protein of unknown function [Kytococcus aerolatus]